MKSIVITLKMLLFALCLLNWVVYADEAPPPLPAYVIVLDDQNRPVPGAEVCLYSTESRSEKNFISDENGQLILTTRWPHSFHPERIGKDGYDGKSWYLNWKTWHLPIRPDRCPKDNPFVLRLRKLNPEREVLIHRTRLPMVDLWDDRPKPPRAISLVGNAASGYVDMFVQPHFDKLKSEWVLSLWTTNYNAGIISTTNRVYVAPEEGYRQRIEVRQKDLQQLSQTIYLKTRPQTLYAMFAFELDNVKMQCGPNITNMFVECKNVYLNPYGGRVLENDTRTDQTSYGSRGIWLSDIVAAGGIPQRLDVPARLENKRQQSLIWEEQHRHDHNVYLMYKKEKEIRKQMEGKSKSEIEKALQSLKEERLREIRKSNECDAKIEKLKDEFPALLLPPGMMEKDKYPDKK